MGHGDRGGGARGGRAGGRRGDRAAGARGGRGGADADPGAEAADWARAIAAALSAGLPVPDARFDRLFGPALQRLAHLHFTPMAAAARAAAWLTAGGATEVCDLGAGAGKFCLVGAATTTARFTGVELRPGLVEVARQAARRLGLERAQFLQGDLRTVPLQRYQAFHVFDPFAEVEAGPDERLDPCVPTRDRADDVARLLARLEAVPAGARLTMFCRLDGQVPRGWTLAERLELDARGDRLDCWVR